MNRTLPALLIALLLMFQGCQKTAEPVIVAQWERYQEPFFKASFSYPKGWHVVSEGNKMAVYSSPEVVDKFYDPTSRGKTGLQLMVAYEKLGTVRPLDEVMNSFRDDKTSEGYTIGDATSRTLDGLSGKQVEYSGRFDENTTLNVIRLLAVKDSMLYFVQYGAFNELFAPNRFLFDTLVTSVRLLQLQPAATAADLTKPSTVFTEFSNNHLQLSHPENFETSTPSPKGGAEFSLEVKGYREDCTIRIDVLPAKGLPVEKVFEQNQKFYRPISRGSSTISGAKAQYLNDSPAKNIKRRVYFLVKNDKVYRMIFTYYQPLEKDYLPAFEKTIASVRLK